MGKGEYMDLIDLLHDEMQLIKESDKLIKLRDETLKMEDELRKSLTKQQDKFFLKFEEAQFNEEAQFYSDTIENIV